MRIPLSEGALCHISDPRCIPHRRVKEHPRVATGLAEEEDALRDFVEGIQDCLPKGTRDKGQCEVTLEAFETYYGNISGGIPSDDYFIYMLEQCWSTLEVIHPSPYGTTCPLAPTWSTCLSQN